MVNDQLSMENGLHLRIFWFYFNLLIVNWPLMMVFREVLW